MLAPETASVFCSLTLSGQDGDILLDYSKNIVSEKTMELLFQLVSIRGVYKFCTGVYMYQVVGRLDSNSGWLFIVQ